MDIASYRDERLQEVVPASVVMELMLMSHAIDTARKEWGALALPENVVKKVNQAQKVGRGRDRRLLAGERNSEFCWPVLNARITGFYTTW